MTKPLGSETLTASTAFVRRLLQEASELNARLKSELGRWMEGEKGAVSLPRSWLKIGEWPRSTAALVSRLVLQDPELHIIMSRRLVPYLWRGAVLRSIDGYTCPGGWALGTMAAFAADGEERACWARLCCHLPGPMPADVPAVRVPVNEPVPQEGAFVEFVQVVQLWNNMEQGRLDGQWPATPLARELLQVPFLRGLRRAAARRAGREVTGAEKKLPGLLFWPHGEVPRGLLAMALEWADAVRRRAGLPSLVGRKPLCAQIQDLAQRCEDQASRRWADRLTKRSRKG